MGYVSKCVYIKPELYDSSEVDPETANYFWNDRTSRAIQTELDDGQGKGWKLHSCQPLPYSNSFLLIWEK